MFDLCAAPASRTQSIAIEFQEGGNSSEIATKMQAVIESSLHFNVLFIQNWPHGVTLMQKYPQRNHWI